MSPLDIVDLPGTYSLTANSPEELIAREYILTQRPDVIVAIVDAAILERSLYLVAELVQLGVPLVVGLNMIDVATQNGTRIDTAKLSEAIGVPVIDLIAAKKIGIDQLVQATIQAARSSAIPIDLPAFAGTNGICPRRSRAHDCAGIARGVSAALGGVETAGA